MQGLIIDVNELNQLLKRHLNQKTLSLEQGLKDSLDSTVFSWGSVTHRKNGETVSDPRNAIDTGELQKSIKSREGKGLRNYIKFNAEYSARVIEHSTVDFLQFTLERIE